MSRALAFSPAHLWSFVAASRRRLILAGAFFAAFVVASVLLVSTALAYSEAQLNCPTSWGVRAIINTGPGGVFAQSVGHDQNYNTVYSDGAGNYCSADTCSFYYENGKRAGVTWELLTVRDDSWSSIQSTWCFDPKSESGATLKLLSAHGKK